MAAAIVRIALPLDQLSLLELVEHADELAAVEVEHVGKRCLGAARPRGVAVATTIATTLTANYVDVHPGTNGLPGGALTHGFQAAFYVLAGIAVFGAVVAALFTESHTRVADAEPAEDAVLAEAAWSHRQLVTRAAGDGASGALAKPHVRRR